MEITSIQGFSPKRNERLLQKAESLRPVLIRKKIKPVKTVQEDKPLGKEESVIYDFGEHYVGYVKLRLSTVGSYPDAPAFIKLKFAEVYEELSENSEEYHGWISKSWIQEEWVHVDSFPFELKLPRRYAFRYLEVKVLDTSLKYKLVIEEVTAEAVSAVSTEDVQKYNFEDAMFGKLEEVSLRTLKNCMQEVFEDGPKRDRRLWLGDLRLQALANYETFKNYDLVKRCLYLFAGTTFPDGRISANIFTDKEPVADDSYFYDYMLFFVCALKDYYIKTNDMEALNDLYAIAMQQIDFGLQRVQDNGVVKGDAAQGDFESWCFVDWCMGLDKQASGQGILIYSIKNAIELTKAKGDVTKQEQFEIQLEILLEATRNILFDENEQLFISGENRQISTASQVWLVLAGVFDQEKNSRILKKIIERGLPYTMVSPYMMHHYCEALIVSGEKEEALNVMKSYWGKMIELGADTFWELFNPNNPDESPYGGKMVNSYCHAWSCTPAYLLRKYYIKE